MHENAGDIIRKAFAAGEGMQGLEKLIEKIVSLMSCRNHSPNPLLSKLLPLSVPQDFGTGLLDDSIADDQHALCGR